MKKGLVICLLCVCLLGCGEEVKELPKSTAKVVTQSAVEKKTWIVPEGKTLESRVMVPDGYTRTKEKKDSLATFLRQYPLKPDGSPILLYDGKKKGGQAFHMAVFELPIEKEDLQQCADSVMRVYAEYYRHVGKEDKIAFHFVNGFLASYSKWRQGYRIRIAGNQCSWVKSAKAGDSDKVFKQYLQVVFAYASTLSMEHESKKITQSDIRAGDVFLRGGSPGHVVMIVDVCQNAEGKKAFLLGQGFMPAQEFHLLKNFEHPEDPWYYEDEVTYPFGTPGYVFDEGSLRRLKY